MYGREKNVTAFIFFISEGNVETLSFLKWGIYCALLRVINQHLHVCAAA